MAATTAESNRQPIDWESFYRDYRKPGYVPGFEILNKLGGGTAGVVFKARKESIGRLYAIKFLKLDDEGVREAVRHELETLPLFAQVDHPHLVSIEDQGEVDGIPYIVMSFAGEQTLRGWIDHRQREPGGIDRIEALSLFVQVARGVHALHERGLVHFDLKPANVYLLGGLARVGDYGLSKLVSRSRNSLTFGRGTPYYMAPEVLNHKGDARSDIYSLGVMLYELLTGDVPFKGSSEWEVLRKHESEAPVFPVGMVDRDREVLERALAKDPAQRFQTAGALLAAITSPNSNAPVRPAPASPSSSPSPTPDAQPVHFAHRARRRARRVVHQLHAALLPGSLGPMTPPPVPPQHRPWQRHWAAVLLAILVLLFLLIVVLTVARMRTSRGNSSVKIQVGRALERARSLDDLVDAHLSRRLFDTDR
jgi:serine/threonine-protein kinase PpkA